MSKLIPWLGRPMPNWAKYNNGGQFGLVTPSIASCVFDVADQAIHFQLTDRRTILVRPADAHGADLRAVQAFLDELGR